ncbi:hypothetical protein AC249_AIPGENE9677 [Exaiptasia diaphana]|nr:hypothetical protein AC249_AIPGENE9677 [Exaiptasia diaphana]
MILSRQTLCLAMVLLMTLPHLTQSLVAGVSSGLTKGRRSQYSNCENLKYDVCQMASKIGCFHNPKREPILMR